jgi:hypothetical protein
MNPSGEPAEKMTPFPCLIVRKEDPPSKAALHIRLSASQKFYLAALILSGLPG